MEPFSETKSSYPVCIQGHIAASNKLVFTINGIPFNPDYAKVKGISWHPGAATGKVYLVYTDLMRYTDVPICSIVQNFDAFFQTNYMFEVGKNVNGQHTLTFFDVASQAAAATFTSDISIHLEFYKR